MLVRFAKTALWRLNREVGGIKFFFAFLQILVNFYLL